MWNSSSVNTAFKQLSRSRKENDYRYRSSLIKAKYQVYNYRSKAFWEPQQCGVFHLCCRVYLILEVAPELGLKDQMVHRMRGLERRLNSSKKNKARASMLSSHGS